MIRKAFVMSVHAGKEEAYEQRHSPIWPELEAVLREHGVQSYSIFLHPETRQLFAYAEIDDQERWEAIAETTVCKRWWAHMKDLMPSNADNSPVSRELKEVFHINCIPNVTRNSPALSANLSTMNFFCLHPRDQIVATMERIYGRNMTTTSGGNISIYDENDDKWMTPARVDKGSLRRQDIVRIGKDGACEGLHPPSSENPFHLSIYAARPDIRAIIHAHPGALVSFSICGQTPDTRLFPEAWNVCGKVAFARYEVPGSKQLGARIAAEFSSEERPNCVVLENHGVVVGGRDLAEAFQRFETLEFTAQTILNARQLGEVHYLSDEQIELFNSGRNLLPEGEPRSMTSREKELRKEISDFVHRAYEHRLMTSTWGSFSARIDRSSFIITPAHADRQEILPSDLIAVHYGRYVPGHQPSRAARLHCAIYERYPEVQAVVNALPVFATAFCVSDFLLDTRTIPESYLFLKDVGTIAFAHQFGDVVEVAKSVTPANPVALLKHNGVMVAGRTVLDAFDRLEVLEATAAAIIQSRPLGAMSPMSDEVTRDLLAAFPGL